jgi:hypothetical protein
VPVLVLYIGFRLIHCYSVLALNLPVPNVADIIADGLEEPGVVISFITTSVIDSNSLTKNATEHLTQFEKGQLSSAVRAAAANKAHTNLKSLGFFHNMRVLARAYNDDFGVVSQPSDALAEAKNYLEQNENLGDLLSFELQSNIIKNRISDEK